MKKLAVFVILISLCGCSKDEEIACYEIIFQKGQSECVPCELTDLEVDLKYTECGITESEARRIITRLGGKPNERVIKINEDKKTATVIYGRYKKID
jgi:hypothetical protein